MVVSAREGNPELMPISSTPGRPGPRALHAVRIAASCVGLLSPLWAAAAPPLRSPGRAITRHAGVAAQDRPAGLVAPPINDGPLAPVPPEVIARDDEGRVTVRAVRLTEPLRVDGRLDEPIYESVPPITGFIQNVPDVGQPSTQQTEVWVLFDADNLYVVARCFDTAPESEWVANEMRRDGNQIRQNDNFGVILDTFYDKRNGTIFYTNPLGGLMDIQVTNEANSNQDWNTVWDVRTGRFDGGWTVEMEIPFKSLRYRPGTAQTWGIQLRRGIRRRNEWAFLTALPPTTGSAAWQRLSMAATLVGLEVPAGSRNFEVKPYGISGLTSDRTVSPSVSNALDGEVGLDVKYGVTQNLTFDFTYNTDFAQVEVDEQQINLTRFNLVFPEKREFFLEGRGLFEFGRGSGQGGNATASGNAPELFFSRQIGLNQGRVVPIQAGARLTGKVGKASIGALIMQTEAEPGRGVEATNFTVLRLRQDILRRSSIGAMFTGRSQSIRAPGASNEAYGVDAAFSFFQDVYLNSYYARTETPGRSGGNESYRGRLNYNADRYGLEVDHLFVGDNFNPEVGFLRRDDMRRTFVSGRFSPRPRSIPLVRRFTWDASLDYIENAAGQLETRQHAAGFDTELQTSDRINVEVNRNYEFLAQPFRVGEGVAIPIGSYNFDRIQAGYTLGQQRKLSGGLSLGYGSFYDGTQTSIGLSQGRIAILRQLYVEPTMSVNWIDLPHGSLTTQLYRARLSYTFTPRMFVAGLVQYSSGSDTISTNVRLRWEYIPGSELFVVYTEDQNADSRRGAFAEMLNRAFVVKFTRLFRF